MQILYSAHTDTGRQRKVNQDWYDVSKPDADTALGRLLVVCDGMGGHLDGEKASRLAVQTILDAYYATEEADRREALSRAFLEANTRVFDEGQGRMGTTGVAALLLDNRLHIANVGDSRAYLIHQGKASQISKDHSFVAEQVAAGIITAEEARHSTQRNMITRALGYRAEVAVDILDAQAVAPGDAILLSSDGMHGLIEDQEIEQIVSTLPPNEAVERLVTLANERGGPDNITVVVARVESLEGDELRELPATLTTSTPRTANLRGETAIADGRSNPLPSVRLTTRPAREPHQATADTPPANQIPPLSDDTSLPSNNRRVLLLATIVVIVLLILVLGLAWQFRDTLLGLVDLA